MRPEWKFDCSRFCQIAFLALALALALVLVSGCSVSRIAANRIIAAPNLHHDKEVKDWTAEWEKTLATMGGGTNPFTAFNLDVGPPSARLTAVQLRPRDCKVVVASEIKGNEGRTNLIVRLLPSTNACEGIERGSIVLLHGYRTRKEFMAPWAFILANAGYRVIVPDLRGHGESTGRVFSGGKYETADLVQLLDHLTVKGHCDGRVGVLGYSFGADLALNWAARDKRVAAVVAIAPYDQPDEAFLRLAKATSFPLGPETLREAMSIAAAKLDVRWNDWSGTSALGQMTVPVMLVAGGRDVVSPPSDFELLRKTAPQGSEALLIPEADHVSVGYAFPRLAEPVKSWFQRHLDLPQLAR